MQGGRALIRIVRTDDQGFRQFARGAGELGQDQHAALIVAGGDKFLGDQVHAVMQAADEAQIGGTKMLVHLFRIVVFDLEHNGAALAPEAVIDLRAMARTCASWCWYSSMPERVGAAIWIKLKRPIHSGFISSRRSMARKRSTMPLV
jgi:hypothetical protein